MNLSQQDPDIYNAINKEKIRQNETLELIPSENFVTNAVLEATGSVMTNKYAEGYPNKRYYGGCHFVDIAEELAIERAKKIFSCDHANVQPHCGSAANMGVYMSILKPGDKIMGMDLAHGGHLTHGFKISFSGKLYKSQSYGVNKETETLDYDEILHQARGFRPKLIVCGASAYPRKIDFKKFREIADDVGALLMADIAHIAGLVVAGIHESPIGKAQFVTTTTHKTLRGPRSGLILCDNEYATKIDKTIMPGMQGGPLMHVIAAKAVCFKEAMQPSFNQYQEQVVKNSKHLAKVLTNGGLRLVTGGTDNHLMLIDLTPNGITGKDAELALDRAGLTVNKNMIPFDTKSPLVTSGIRLGTPAITSRGMKEPEMDQIGEWILKIIKDIQNTELQEKIRLEIKQMCEHYPLY